MATQTQQLPPASVVPAALNDDWLRHARPNLLDFAGGDQRPAAFATAPLPSAAGAQWRAVSLFCGGGGLDLGFLAEGVRTDAAWDNSRSALAAYDANLPTTGRLADLARVQPDNPCDVLLAGAPCQGFSTAGKRFAGDPRNALLGRVADVALVIKPKVVVLENVPAALSGEHGRLWRTLEGRLRLAGYMTATLTLHGDDSGIAQRRRRLVMICWREGGDVRVEMKTVPAPPLRAALAGVDDLVCHRPQWATPGSIEHIVARSIGPGQKLCNVRASASAVPTWAIPEAFGPTTPDERQVLEAVRTLRRRDRARDYGDGDPVSEDRIRDHLGADGSTRIERLVEGGFLRRMAGGLELRHTYNGKYRRLNWDQPSPTVDTHFGRTTLFMHPDQDRGMSAREAARIQGFPDAYRLAGPPNAWFDTIGNAVPPPMAARIARFVREALLKR